MVFVNGVELSKMDGNQVYSDAAYTKDFKIKHCPNGVYKDFEELAKIVGENSYWMTLKILIESFKKGATYDIICQAVDTLDKRVSVLELQSKKESESSESEYVVEPMGLGSLLAKGR